MHYFRLGLVTWRTSVGVGESRIRLERFTASSSKTTNRNCARR